MNKLFKCVRAVCILVSGVACACPSIVAADAYKPAKLRLDTPWTNMVSPESVWAEYPRPQFVRKNWLNLNGLWEYAIAKQTEGAPASYQGNILVPFAVESALSGVAQNVGPEERLWYRRSFDVPKTWTGDRILLHFGAVDYSCVVWINNALVGAHEGGFDPFSFDITDYLKGGKNELRLVVRDPTDKGEQPRGKQRLSPSGIWYTPVTGIWQTVWLEPAPNLHLAELRITPNVAGASVSVEALANMSTTDDRWAVRLTVSRGVDVVATAIGRINRAVIIPMPKPRLWSPSDPFLYDLKAELIRVENPQAGKKRGTDNPPIPKFGAQETQAYASAKPIGEAADVVMSYFGMREVKIGPGLVKGQPAILLNGQPLFQHGPLDQGWWPDGLHTPPSDAAMIWEIEWLKRAGFNMLRKHIKVEPARYYYHCDRLGILVWQDMPSGFNQGLQAHWTDEDEPIRRSTSREQHELELRRMIGRLYNHPSIVMWVIHNEGWGQYESASLATWVKAIDPSRIVNADSGWLDKNVGEVFDIHTYEPIPQTPDRIPDRAIVIGEYGGVGLPLAGHLWNPDMRNWGYQTYTTGEKYKEALMKKLEALIPMYREVGLSAAVYTQTTDVEGEVNGLLTYDRKVEKITPEELAAFHQRLIKGKNIK